MIKALEVPLRLKNLNVKLDYSLQIQSTLQELESTVRAHCTQVTVSTATNSSLDTLLHSHVTESIASARMDHHHPDRR